MALMNSAIIGSDEFVYGLCEVQQLTPEVGTFAAVSFGQARDVGLKRTADREELEKCDGDLMALLLRNPRYELTMTMMVKKTLEVAELASRIMFPLAGIYGSLLEWDLKWQSKGTKMLDIQATHWDALGSSPTVTVL
jgi:hypothetical protein